MKIGERQQQGRAGTKNQKIECPICHDYYLESMRNTRGQKIGMYCPSKTCPYCKKD